MDKLSKLFSVGCEYNDTAKKAFMNEGVRVMRALAKELNLVDYSVRKNAGGIAVPGDVILHTPTFYLATAGWGRDLKMLLRTCKGTQDYTGGPNTYCSPQLLYDAKAFKAHAERIGIQFVTEAAPAAISKAATPAPLPPASTPDRGPEPGISESFVL